MLKSINKAKDIPRKELNKCRNLLEVEGAAGLLVDVEGVIVVTVSVNEIKAKDIWRKELNKCYQNLRVAMLFF